VCAVYSITGPLPDLSRRRPVRLFFSSPGLCAKVREIGPGSLGNYRYTGPQIRTFKTTDPLTRAASKLRPNIHSEFTRTITSKFSPNIHRASGEEHGSPRCKLRSADPLNRRWARRREGKERSGSMTRIVQPRNASLLISVIIFQARVCFTSTSNTD
jgi:hypothetical protein